MHKKTKQIVINILCITGILCLVGCGEVKQTPAAPESEQETEAVEFKEPEITEDNFEQYDILLPGCQGEYDLLFLTDMHISVPTEGSQEVRAYVEKRRNMFTAQEGSGNEASEYFKAFLAYGKKREIDALLLGGDIIDSPSEGNLGFLKETLGQLNIPYLYALGNHDWTYPWNYMTPEGKEEYLPLLSPYMKENVYFSTMEFEDFLIVCLDNSSNQFSAEALEDYRQVLKMGKPVMLMFHVPLLTEPLLEKAKQVWKSDVVIGVSNQGGIVPNKVSGEIMQLTLSEESPVFMILAGHVHFSDSSTLKNNSLQIVGGAGYMGRGVLLHISGQGN